MSRNIGVIYQNTEDLNKLHETLFREDEDNILVKFRKVGAVPSKVVMKRVVYNPHSVQGDYEYLDKYTMFRVLCKDDAFKLAGMTFDHFIFVDGSYDAAIINYLQTRIRS